MDSLHRYIIFSQNAINLMLRFEKRKQQLPRWSKKAPVVLKHKVGYSTEEEAEARAKMNGMQLDPDAERTKE